MNTPFNIGDQVIKNMGDYKFHGTVVSVITKLKGDLRYVVEDGRGLLLIMSEKQIEKVRDRPARHIAEQFNLPIS